MRGPPPLPLHNKRRDVGAGAVGSKSAHRCNFVIVSTPLTLQLRAAIHPPKLGESPEETKWMTGFALFLSFSVVSLFITAQLLCADIFKHFSLLNVLNSKSIERYQILCFEAAF